MTQTQIAPAHATGAASHGIPKEEVLDTARMVKDAHQRLLGQLEQVIIGQREVIDQMMLALLCQGHAILEGVPGLAKTLMISSLARLLSLDFGRIQFTPDLMPSDITGTEILEEDHTTGKRFMKFVKGPLFANIILADEINRTPPKTQAALLQAMQEYQVTAAGQHYPLQLPFFVLGTQNPIESEGTYPLPEAQLDRFMLKIKVDYPSREDEIEITMATTGRKAAPLEPVLGREDILRMQTVVREVLVARPVAAYIVSLVRATRPAEATAAKYCKEYLTWGAGTRACQSLLLCAKAMALLDGRTHVAADDVRAIAKPVLRHRLVTNFSAESEKISADDIIEQLIADVKEE
jgi:MoxR-like ATPase